MGLNFRKSISLGKGLKLNLSKSGPSVSFGKSGFRQSVNLKGQARTTVGIPGTGIYYTKNTNVKNVVSGLTGKAQEAKNKKAAGKAAAKVIDGAVFRLDHHRDIRLGTELDVASHEGIRAIADFLGS